METDKLRQYIPPERVSAATATHYRHFRPSSTPSNGLSPLPDSHDLVSIKSDVENLLDHAETRIKHLKRDLNHLENNVRVLEQDDNKDGSYRKDSTSGKNMNVVLEKMRIKQEEIPDDLSDSFSRNQHLDRQAALESLRRRRRREDTDNTTDDERSALSDVSGTKIKRTDGIHGTARSESPPVSRGTKQFPSTEIKKKKTSSGSSTPTPHLPHRSGHASTNGDLMEKRSKTKASTKNSHNGNDQIDFVRVKAKDQAPIVNFWAYVDPFFRPLAEEDRQFLMEKDDEVKPYIIPSLGRYYVDVWAEDDRNSGSSSRPSSPTPHARQGSHEPSPLPEKLKYLGPHQSMTDDYLLAQDLCCGTLTERLLSSLVNNQTPESTEHILADNDDDDDDDDDDDRMSLILDDRSHEGRVIAELISHAPKDVMEFEERLKNELRYIGLFGDDDGDWHAHEDDEVCAELRALGRELKEQVSINEFRKKRLLHITDRQLGYEQYRQALDNFEVQVEQCYMKRFRTQKSKKRKPTSGQRSMLSENAVFAMEKRRNWINALESIFEDRNHFMPTTSIYEDPDDESLHPGGQASSADTKT